MGQDEFFDNLDAYAAPKAQAAEPAFGTPKVKGIDLEAENPFLTIWIRPRATIKGIVRTDPTYRVVPLASLLGIVQMLDRFSQRNAGDQMILSAILVVSLIIGPISGLIGLYLGGALLRWTGSKFGGRANPEEVRAAIAWSSVPAIATLPIWAVQLGLIGHEMFTSKTPYLNEHPVQAMLLVATGVIELVLGIWAFVLLLKCLGQVHRFSAWKSLGSLLLLMAIFMIPLMLIVFLVIMMNRG